MKPKNGWNLKPKSKVFELEEFGYFLYALDFFGVDTREYQQCQAMVCFDSAHVYFRYTLQKGNREGAQLFVVLKAPEFSDAHRRAKTERVFWPTLSQYSPDFYTDV
jgi:hypothetical protein